MGLDEILKKFEHLDKKPEIEGVKIQLMIGNKLNPVTLHKKFEDITSLGGIITNSTDRNELNYSAPSWLSLIRAYNGSGFRNTTPDWNDKSLLRSPKIRLTRLSYDDLVINCREAIHGLTVEMTLQRAAIILNLVWNMRSKADPRVRIFPENPQEAGDQSIDELSTIDELCTDRFKNPHGNPASSIAFDRGVSANWELIRQTCYLCASLMRLFSKDVHSWKKSGSHIRSQYRRLTGANFTISTESVEIECLKALSMAYRNYKMYVNTLGEILYALHDVEEGERKMIKMVFEEQLSLTGMHIVDLFCKSVRGMNCIPYFLINLLWLPSNDSTLCELAHLIKHFMASRYEDRVRETYRFARLFDSDVFPLLRTQDCRQLVCILAHLCKLVDSEENQDVLRISVLDNMSDWTKKMLLWSC